MRKLALHWQILIAILLAVIVGSLVKSGTTDEFAPNIFGISFVAIFDYIGSMFLNALKMIIVPLITSSIIVGVAGIGSGGNLGSLGGKTLLFYATTTLAAILVGLIIINVVQPGIADGQPAGDMLALEANTTDISAKVEGRGIGDVAEVFKRMVPANIVKAAAEGQMLGLIFFAILFGYFMTHLAHQYAEPLFNFWNGVFPGCGSHGDGRILGGEAPGDFCDLCCRRAGRSRIHHAAVIAALRRPRETLQDDSGRLTGHADGFLDGVLIGDPAGHNGQRRGQYRRLQQGVEFRAAAGRDRQHERHSTV
jgi:hypothetical protein